MVEVLNSKGIVKKQGRPSVFWFNHIVDYKTAWSELKGKCDEKGVLVTSIKQGLPLVLCFNRTGNSETDWSELKGNCVEKGSWGNEAGEVFGTLV